MRKTTRNRILSAVLALAAVVSLLPMISLPAQTASESDQPQQETVLPPAPELTYDYDTLKITLDGEETYSLSLPEHEKVTIKAEGLQEESSYQWQILNPEKEDQWVNIYDATDATLSLSAALLKNMLSADGTAQVRCRAYTDDYAYLTPSFTATLVQEVTVESETYYAPVNPIKMAEGDPAPEFVTITIEYWRYDYEKNSEGKYELGSNPTQAFSSYIATIPYNTTFHATVTVPTIVGYEAHLENSGAAITKVELNYNDPVTQNQVVKVNYKPAKVNYTVRYYFQNIYDDNYVEDTGVMQSLKGETGSAPEDSVVKKEFTGFTSMFYQPDTIAADGSTVFEVYYERNYYLMDFDCNGGYGADPVYVRYGTYISIPTPKKSGWTFDYWYLTRIEEDDNDDEDKDPQVTIYDDTDADALPLTMPAYNSHYKAVWGRAETTFTVIYWVQNADDDGYSYAGSIEKVTAKTGDAVSLDTITNYTDPDSNTAISKTCPVAKLEEYVTLNTAKTVAVTVEGDGSTNFNIYFDRNEYTLRFYYARSKVDSSGVTWYQITYGTEQFDGSPDSVTKWSNDNQTEPVLSNKYNKQTEEIGDYTYYYFLVTAKFGQNLELLWPDAPIENAKDKTTYGRSFVSWGPDPDSKYYKDHPSNRNIKGPYSVLDDNWIIDPNVTSPAINHSLCAYWGEPSMWNYEIYFETLPGQTVDKTYKDANYTLYNTYVIGAQSNINDMAKTVLSFVGVNHIGTDNDGDATLYFYYQRLSHALKFDNYGSVHKEDTVSYGQSIASFVAAAGAPAYPATLEPGAYYFVGWYTGPNGTGEQITADTTMTMPDAGLSLFAYWKPVEHDVYFYLLYTDIDNDDDPDDYWYTTDNNGNQLPGSYPIVVEHGDLLGTTYSNIPTRDKYRFVGWFYMDENGKKRFAPDSMEIKQELHLFAEWQSDIDTTYVVRYELKEDAIIDGIEYPAGKEIGAATEGHSTAGKTKTFSAKGDTDLYLAFRESIFPETGSHSILMQEKSTENVYTFQYVYDDEVWYKVRYVDFETKKVLKESAPIPTNHAVVTEKFLPIPNYIPMPGYYYQTKALTADNAAGGSESNVIAANIITFYYMKDTDHGAYSIEYYLQNADGSYTQATSIQNTADLKDSEGNATIINSGSLANGDEFEILTFDGYRYTEAEIIYYKYTGDVLKTDKITDTSAVVQGQLDSNGLTIKLYYNRLEYSYEIHLVEYGTNKVLGYGKIDVDSNGNVKYSYDLSANHAPEAETAFGTVISYIAPASFTIDKRIYEYYIPNATESQRTDSITIRATTEDNPDTTDKNEFNNPNILKFYFTQKQYTVHYKAICTVPGVVGGVVSPSSQIVTTVGELSATATASEGFKFVGWYEDEAHTQKIDASEWVSGTTLTPQTIVDGTTYYALFTPITSSMTITKQVGDGKGTVTDNFLFSIKGQGKNSYIDLTVVITGNGSAVIDNLPIGDYTVTELTAWSWEYSTNDIVVSGIEAGKYALDISNASISFTAVEQDSGNSKNQITFANTYQESDWLSSESDVADNDFGTPATP